jgi:FkbM family methyltransferase
MNGDATLLIAKPSSRRYRVGFRQGVRRKSYLVRYGRWISNAAAALKRRRNSTILRQKLIALEANKTRFDLMIKNCEQNEIPASDIELLRMACTPNGSPVLMTCNDDYGAAVFKNDVLLKSCEGESVPMGGHVIEKVPAIRLEELIKEEVDFLDIDIQGAELGVIASCIDVLDRFVKMAHVGTHSPTIDAKLSDMFSLHRWQPRFIFPCGQVNETPYGTFQFIDGIQSWENPRFNWMP